MIEKERFEIIVKIARRAEEMNLMVFDRMALMMDLECADKEFNLRLTDFLNADKFNFAHDIIGIQNNLDRRKKEMGNFFVPRYAGHE